MKKWIKVCLLLLGIVAVSVGIYFILRAFGVTNIDKLREIIASCGAWGWIAFIALFTTCSTLLCFMPGTSATFIGVAIVMFGAWKGFAISTISVFLSSSLMFFIGHHFGEKAAIKLVGKESLEKAQNLIDVKSKMLLPLMFLFPVFPDDALCMVAGMTKMRYWYFAAVVAIFRTIGIASICFLGSGLINWAELSLVDWFVVITCCLVWIFAIFKYQHKIEKFITRKKEAPAAEEKRQNAKAKKSKEENLADKLQELDNAIVKNLKKLEEKKYCSAQQKEDIKNKIEKIEIEREKVAKKLNIEIEPKKNTARDAGEAELQELVCKELEAVMAKHFSSTEFRIQKSLSTTSVYLVLIHNSGVEKVVRFSDHNSKKMATSYSVNRILSEKSTKKIIQQNLKVLNRKALYVLMNKVSNERKNREDK